MSRIIHCRYRDPVELIWLHIAERLGMSVYRSDEVYASWDGQGSLTLAGAAHFDLDDSLAQMIFHEICHAFIEGLEGYRQPDWGLDNTDDRDLYREHACQRLQAALTAPYGLRALLAPTTDHRAYYDALPVDPLDNGDDPAIPLARIGYARAQQGIWAETLASGLAATAAIARSVKPFAQSDSLWSKYEPCTDSDVGEHD